MSGSGFRGRGIEPRDIHPNGPIGVYRGTCSSHPRFSQPRLPHNRLPPPENWSGRSKHDLRFSSWSNAKFQRSMFPYFHHHGRGRDTIHRENLRFSDSNRLSIVPYSADHKNNSRNIKTRFRQNLQDDDQSKNNKRKSCLQQIPLLGSEEERQKKITETAVRLKEKLSIITNEDITNLWRDDLSTVPLSNVKDKNILKLGHEQPELNLTSNDFQNIGKADVDDIKSDKTDGINEVKNLFNFICDNVNEVRNSIKDVDATDNDKNILCDESMTIINDKIITKSKSQKDNDNKSQEDIKSPQHMDVTLSNVSKACNTKLTNYLEEFIGKTNMLQTQDVLQSDNTRIEDHELNTKCVNTSLKCQSKCQIFDNRLNLENARKSSDDMQKSHWKPSKHQKNVYHRKPFKSKWSHRNHSKYVFNRSQNESTRFNQRVPPIIHLHRNMTSLNQDSQCNILSSYDINRSQPQFPTMPNLMHNKNNSVSISSGQEDILQTESAFDSWESSTAISYNPHSQEQIINIPNFNPQQPPPNFNNQKGTLPLPSIFNQCLLPQNQSNSALNSLQTSVISVSPIDLYNPVNITASSNTILEQATTFSTLSQINIPSSSSLLSTASINFSPILTHTASVKMTPYEVTSSATISKVKHQAKHFYNKALDSAPILNQDNEVNGEFQEIQEAPKQFANQATNITNDVNINTESEEPLFSGILPLNTSTEQQDVSDVLSSFTQIQQSIKKEEEQMDQHCNKFTEIILKERVINESHESFNFEHEKQLNPNYNVEKSALADTQNRPKVMFHLNSKLKKINKQEKQHENIEDAMRERYISCTFSPDHFHKMTAKEYSNQKIEECANEMITSNQDKISKCNIEIKDINTISLMDESQKFYLESPMLITCDNSTVQTPQDVINKKKKIESPPSEFSWKDKIISRFLKMSKNDICNMINNSSLRKFDIAMKHLVKEKRSLLSLEMRNTEDEKIKSYDKEEFMDQLNAMLDPTAIVDITNLPTDFIHHLNEVLQLDVMPLESNENIFDYTNDQDNNSHIFSNEEEILNNNIISKNINLEQINDRTQAEHNNQSKDEDNRVLPSIITESNISDNNIVPIVNSFETNENNILHSNEIFSKTLLENNDLQIDHFTNNVHVPEKDITQKDVEKKQHSLFNAIDLDDIVSTVTTKASDELKLTNLEEKSKYTIKKNKTSEIVKTSIPTEITSVNDTSFTSKSKIFNSAKPNEYISKSERYNRWWIKKERDEPDVFRNLTKEEWEAKYGKKMKNLTSNPSKTQISRYSDNTNVNNTRYNKTFNSKNYPSPHSFKTNKSSFSPKTTLCKKVSKRDNVENDSNTSSSSQSETDDDTDSTSSDNRTPSDVAKLLKVIKEKEKIAKNKSLNETIRDEVTAEIHRRWNEEDRKKKYHKKDKGRKEKKLKYEKERKKRRRTISESSSNSNNDKIDTRNLVKEIKAKKKTIIKEIDTGVEVLESNIVNNTCSEKQKTIKDKKIILEDADKCIVKESSRITMVPTIMQLKTQLQSIPETSKSVEETEFMKNTAKIVLSAKCHEKNKASVLNNEDKQKIILKKHQNNKNISETNEDSERQNNILINVEGTEHIVQNNNDDTTKKLTNTSTIKEQSCKDKICRVEKEALSVIPAVHESNAERLIDRKVTSKKIDIKAYKARTLQRKMKNEEKINEEKAIINDKHAINNDILSTLMIMEKPKPDNYISQETMSYTNLKDKNSITQTDTISADSSKFKHIKSEGNRELKLKKEKIEKNKKKTEVKKKVKEGKEISSVSQENSSDVLKSLENEVEKNQIDVHSDKHKNQSITDNLLLLKKRSSIDEIYIQNEEIANNIIPSISELKDTSSKKNERIINNDRSVIVTIDKEKYMETSEMINIKKKDALNDIQTKNTNHNNILSSIKYDPNNLKFRKRAIFTSNEVSTEPKIYNLINTDEVNSQEYKNEKQFQENIESWDLPESDGNLINLGEELLSKIESKLAESESNFVKTYLEEDNKCLEEDESQKNMKMSKDCTNTTSINIISQNEQGLEKDTAIINQTNPNLLENQNNLNIGKNIINSTSNLYDEMIDSIESKVNSPESPSSPFKGFVADFVESDSYQHMLHLEIQSTATPDKGNTIEGGGKQLQLFSNDALTYNNIPSENILKDSLNVVERLNEDEGKSSYEKDFRMNDSATILNNNFNLLDNKDQTEEMTCKNYPQNYADNFKKNEKDINRFKQSEYSLDNNESMGSVNVEKNIHDVSNKQDKIFPGLYECEDNAVMEKPDIDIVNNSLIKEERSCEKDISNFIPTSDINLSDMNNTINSSFSNVSNETLNNIINTDTDSSLTSLINSNTIENNNADIPNQTIENPVTNIDSHEEASANDNNSYSNKNTYNNFNYNSISTERLWRSSIQEAPMKLKVPTKAALKESRNITAITDFVKKTMKLENLGLTEHEYDNQNIDHLITDQVSQKENIDNAILNSEQSKSSQDLHVSYMSDSKDSHECSDTNILSETVLNKAKAIHNETLIPSNHNCFIKELINSNKTYNPTIESERMKETNKSITDITSNYADTSKIDVGLNKTSYIETQKQESTRYIAPDSNKKIKEEIMARMIKIDVEIHKLMSEKMILYKMLENDYVLTSKFPLTNNLEFEMNKDKTLIRSQASPTVVSHTNADVSFVSEIISNEIEPKIRNIDENKQKSLLTEENINCTRNVSPNNFKDRLLSDCSGSSQSLSIFTNEKNIQEDNTVLSENQLKENLDTYNSIRETSSNVTKSTSLENISYIEKKKHLYMLPISIKKSYNENQQVQDTSYKEKQKLQYFEVPQKKNNSMQASLIYSDDSTWGSFAQSSENIEEKKHNTGLALLEETYKREMAEDRKLKANARKKKKKELDKFLKSVNYLTPEEEDIPLNTLYIKKLQQKRDLLDSLNDKKENSTMDNCENSFTHEKILEHAIAVINAVAEDRVKDLYEEKNEENLNENLTISSNKISQNEVTFTKPIQNLNESTTTTSSLNCNQEENSIKHSSNITLESVTQQKLKQIKEDEGSVIKDIEVQSTAISCSNQNVNFSIMDMSNDNDINQQKTSSIDETTSRSSIPVLTEANQLNVSNEKLSNDQSNHALQKNSVLKNINNFIEATEITLKGSDKKDDRLENQDTTVNNSIHEQCKYNSKTEEDMKQDNCLLEDKKMKIPKIEIDEITSNISQISNIQDNKILKCKISNKNTSRKNSKSTEDNINHVEHDGTNLNDGTDSSKIQCNSKDISPIHQELENTLSNMKCNLKFQKLENSKNTKYIKPIQDESFKCQLPILKDNVLEHISPNIDSQILTPKIRDIAAKRKMHSQSEMMNCKVRLVDVFKSNLYQIDQIPNKFHMDTVKSPTPTYKSTAIKATINSQHFATSSKTNSLIVKTNKSKDIKKVKNISDNVQEQTSNLCQKQVTNTYNILKNKKEIKFHQKVNPLLNDEHLSLKSNNEGISVIPIKTVPSIMKISPQQNEELDIAIVEERKKDVHHIVDLHHDKETPLSEKITENEQILRKQYIVHKGPILDIKVFGDTFLAASEDGSIYRYSQESIEILNIYKGHRSAVTCIYIHKSSNTDHLKDTKNWIYSGSLDGTLRCYDIKTGMPINNIANVGSPVQCMDQAWGIIFIGTKSGHVSRFHIKCGAIKGDSIQFSDKSVLALKATNEGPRRVLIVASRNQPITIRDAQNGLFLRTICGQKNHTVYSLMQNNNLIYCGTSSTSILVFDFTNGEQKAQYDAGVGIVCIRLYYKLLFAGCYDGNIYVFDIQDHKLVCSIPGPGNMLLSMEVVDNKIIAGSKDKRLQTWQIPKQLQMISREIT